MHQFYLTGKCGLFALMFCFLLFAFCPPNLAVLLLNCLRLLPTRLAPSMLLLPKKLLPSMVLLSILLPMVLLKLALHASITGSKPEPPSAGKNYTFSPTYEEVQNMIKSNSNPDNPQGSDDQGDQYKTNNQLQLDGSRVIE